MKIVGRRWSGQASLLFAVLLCCLIYVLCEHTLLSLRHIDQAIHLAAGLFSDSSYIESWTYK
jgi:hypothetical protein